MSSKNEENMLVDVLTLVKQVWRHRPGLKLMGRTIWQDQTIPAAILDTMDALRMETKDGLKPLLVKHCPTEYGAKLIWSLPPGISRKEIENKLQYFEEQAKGQIFLQNKGKTLIMEVYTAELPKMVPFEYTESNHLLPVPVGVNAKGELHLIDLARIPHMLVAGQTGGGKSNFLHILIIYLLMTRREIWPMIVDLKRLEFAYLSKHCLVIDDEKNTCKLLHRLNCELDRRLIELRDAGCRNIIEYKGEMPFIVLVIDEVAELTDKTAQEDLNRLARLARAAGIHIVAATQRPDATLFKDFAKTRALLPGRLCFTVADEVNSRIVLGNDAAHKIPKNVPGRAVWKWEEETIVQSMYLSTQEAEKLLAAMPAAKGGMIFEQSTTRLLPR
ncbi:MAG: DNA translocase FtsK [Firmicutes bacterium]|nr:DNA translocase FtsK [Bacillota bacterium]